MTQPKKKDINFDSPEFLSKVKETSELDKFYAGLLDNGLDKYEKHDLKAELEQEISELDHKIALKMGKVGNLANDQAELEQAHQRIEQEIYNIQHSEADNYNEKTGDSESLDDDETSVNQIADSVINTYKKLYHKQLELARMEVHESAMEALDTNKSMFDVEAEEIPTDYSDQDSVEGRVTMLNEILSLSEYLMRDDELIDEAMAEQLDQKIDELLDKFDNLDKEDIEKVNQAKARRDLVFKYNKFQDHKDKLEQRNSSQIWADLVQFASVDYNQVEVSLDDLRANKQELLDKLNADFHNNKLNAEDFMKYTLSVGKLYDGWIGAAERKLEQATDNGQEQEELSIEEQIAAAYEGAAPNSEKVADQNDEEVVVTGDNKVKINLNSAPIDTVEDGFKNI